MINDTEAQDLRRDVKKQVQQLKDWLDKERRSREAKLNKAAIAEKKKRIGELVSMDTMFLLAHSCSKHYGFSLSESPTAERYGSLGEVAQGKEGNHDR